ncbi:PUT1 [Candida oxycetoniae]|uniref:Proline dehydrogenase n=1 Tax=Candida oxycetoniae TaxID=497107 RepID=A0AAI9SYZ6_9ASCO|nr:PUT1 [Candida oxycetoniae]KAI3405190.2 PUT1 [Candida oxycetoniae]
MSLRYLGRVSPQSRSIFASCSYLKARPRYRLFHDTSSQKSTTINSSDHHNDHHHHHHIISPGVQSEAAADQSLNTARGNLVEADAHPHSTQYLKAFDNKELFSFLLMGLCTSMNPVLRTCIKVFPYVPISVIKALVYRIYCGGDNIQDVRKTARRLHSRGINNVMISLTIEACEGNDNIDPEYIIDETIESINGILVPHTVEMIETAGKDINDIPSGYVALKPTGFVKNAPHVLKNYRNGEEKAFDELVAKASRACQAVYDANIELAKKYPQRVAPFVVAVIDAEKYDLQPAVYELQRQLYQKFNQMHKPVNVVGTLQMYLSDSANLLAYEEKLANQNNYRLGLKLVRGAYIHSEKARSTVIHKTKQDTDDNYNAGISYCIDSILEPSSKANSSTIGHLVVASHNAESLRLASSKVYSDANVNNKNKNNVVLGQLLGMADEVTYDLIQNNKINNVIKYVPWGPPLETKEYLLRRLEENGDAVKSGNGWTTFKATFNTLMGRLFKSSA